MANQLLKCEVAVEKRTGAEAGQTEYLDDRKQLTHVENPCPLLPLLVGWNDKQRVRHDCCPAQANPTHSVSLKNFYSTRSELLVQIKKRFKVLLLSHLPWPLCR